MKKILVLSMFLFIFYMNAFAVDLKGTTIHIADDGAEWAPYTYYQRVDDKPSTEIIGYSVDVISAILKKNGIKYTIELLPWKRAQLEVKSGEKFQLILNASYNEERAANYYMSSSYYFTTPHYFYSKKNNPKGIVIKTKDDVKKYKVGGLRGYNYDFYGADVNTIDTGADTFEQLFQKLNNKRFEVFFEQFEIIAGYSATVKNVLADKDLAYAPITYLEPTKFYMLMPKNEVGAELKKIIDEGIASMEKSGELKKILKKYVP